MSVLASVEAARRCVDGAVVECCGDDLDFGFVRSVVEPLADALADDELRRRFDEVARG